MIGKEFNQNSKTVRVHGHLHGNKPPFLKDLFINAQIWLSDKTVASLPEKAIINENGNNYIFVGNPNLKKEGIDFLKINVKTSSTNNGFTQFDLIDEIPTNMQIVTDGAYYIYAQSKNGELNHEH